MKIQKQKNKGYRGYIFSREINGNFIPQRVQNLVIKDFTSRKNIFFKLSATEYKMKNSYYILKSLLKNISNLDGIVFYSYEMLPENKGLRLSILQKLINKKKKIFFALEELKILNKQDLKMIENLISIKKNSAIKKLKI
jgi:sporadic carbohydrate cluster protein (TIGR04323 family)